MKQAGLFWMLVEPERGGGVSIDTAVEVIELIAEADGSAGWGLMASSISTWTSSRHYPGLRRLFEDGKAPITCGTTAPLGTAVKVDGGYRVTTEPVPFGSGMDAADWVGTSVRLVDENGQPVLREDGSPLMRALRAPKSETMIYGDWDVMGMAATGSYSYGWTDHFVRDEFTFDSAGLAPPPGADFTGERLDPQSAGVIGHGAVVLGLMRRSLREVAGVVEGKRRMAYAVPVDEYAVFRKDLVEADAKFWAVRKYFHRVIREGIASTAQTQTLTVEQMARIRQATTHLHMVAAEVVMFASLWGAPRRYATPATSAAPSATWSLPAAMRSSTSSRSTTPPTRSSTPGSRVLCEAVEGYSRRKEYDMPSPIAECGKSIVGFHDPRPAGIVDVARTYEREGWDGTVFADSQSIAPDAFVILTMIAMSAERIRFTTGVTVPLARQPAVVASRYRRRRRPARARPRRPVRRCRIAVPSDGSHGAGVRVRE